MNEQPLIEVENLCKSFGNEFALKVQALDVPKGNLYCLLGPTGAGKSTLLRLLAALDTPTSGEIRFDRRAIDAKAISLTNRRRIAMVFQRPLLLRGSVKTNVEYGLRLRRRSNLRIAAVDDMLEKLNLSRIREQPAHTLSGGQAQLVALARTLVIEPDLLLLDEPSANLDPAHVALVEDVVAEVNNGLGTTIVWATHNIFQARRVADRVALLLDGSVIEDAPTKAFFESPLDSRTADFVQGRMIF